MRWLSLSAVAVVGAATLAAPSALAAAATLQVSTTFPASTSVGQTGTVVVTLTNPTGAGVTPTTVNVLPSCTVLGAAGPNVPLNCTTAATGVFTLVAGPPGATPCPGVLVVGPEVGATGFPITGFAAVPANTSCTVTLTQKAIKTPPDVDGVSFGFQTFTGAAVTDAGGTTSIAGVPNTVTVSKATPTVTTTASAGGNIGTAVKASATVTGRQSPLTTPVPVNVTFKLFSDNACSIAVYTSPAVLQPVADGAVDSPTFEPTAAGTYYWRAFYSGDDNNNPASSVCGAPGSTVTIGTPSNPPNNPPNPGGTGTCLGKTVTIPGGSGNDLINGTAGPDVIDGGSGNDTINGLGGDDTICGGSGNDVMNGGAGNDVFDGGSGSDTSTQD